ncbi:2OG-Fe dioxygenase family protein [Nonomuraea sp. NPDC002799]
MAKGIPMAPFYKVFDLPPVAPSILAEFGTLPLDPYTGGRQRSRRFSQYRIRFNAQAGSWGLGLLPHRPFLQPPTVNTLVGGLPRELEPLRIDPSPQIDAAAGHIGLDEGHDWHINVHQCRVKVGAGVAGVSVPEGPHRDGHDYAMLAVFARHNISGGENQLMPLGGGEPFFRVTLQPNQALAFDDTAMWHTATDLDSLDGGLGHRDLWIVVFNRWDRRKYGEEFEARAVAGRAGS